MLPHQELPELRELVESQDPRELPESNGLQEFLVLGQLTGSLSLGTLEAGQGGRGEGVGE